MIVMAQKLKVCVRVFKLTCASSKTNAFAFRGAGLKFSNAGQVYKKHY